MATAGNWHFILSNGLVTLRTDLGSFTGSSCADAIALFRREQLRRNNMRAKPAPPIGGQGPGGAAA